MTVLLPAKGPCHRQAEVPRMHFSTLSSSFPVPQDTLASSIPVLPQDTLASSLPVLPQDTLWSVFKGMSPVSINQAVNRAP